MRAHGLDHVPYPERGDLSWPGETCLGVFGGGAHGLCISHRGRMACRLKCTSDEHEGILGFLVTICINYCRLFISRGGSCDMLVSASITGEFYMMGGRSGRIGQ